MDFYVPDYYDEFHCLAGDCPHSCCIGWEVVIDEDTAEKYRKMEGVLGEKLREHLDIDENGEFCFSLCGENCPFLTEDHLCEIQAEKGESFLSETCDQHPRMTEDYGSLRELNMDASCPEACRLLLASEEPLTFVLRSSEPEEGENELDYYLPHFLHARARMLDALKEREHSLHARLNSMLEYAALVQEKLDEEAYEEVESVPYPEISGEVTMENRQWNLLTRLESMDASWGKALKFGKMSGEVRNEIGLERVAEYFAYRYLLKAISDDDLMGRTRFCVFSTLAVAKLAGVLGLPEALRLYAEEVEHSEDNVEFLTSEY